MNVTPRPLPLYLATTSLRKLNACSPPPTHPPGGPRDLIEAVEAAGYGAALWKEGQDDAGGALHV